MEEKNEYHYQSRNAYLKWANQEKISFDDKYASIRQNAFEGGHSNGFSMGYKLGTVTGIVIGGIVGLLLYSSCTSRLHTEIEKNIQTPIVQVENSR
jgi:hypothetical protein